MEVAGSAKEGGGLQSLKNWAGGLECQWLSQLEGPLLVDVEVFGTGRRVSCGMA